MCNFNHAFDIQMDIPNNLFGLTFEDLHTIFKERLTF
jgi:hypothetical protein